MIGSVIFEGAKIVTSCVASTATSIAVGPVLANLIPEGISTGKKIFMMVGSTAMTGVVSSMVFNHVSNGFESVRELLHIKTIEEAIEES